jgi:hypothetical protein
MFLSAVRHVNDFDEILLMNLEHRALDRRVMYVYKIDLYHLAYLRSSH